MVMHGSIFCCSTSDFKRHIKQDGKSEYSCLILVLEEILSVFSHLTYKVGYGFVTSCFEA